jgi:hypothetical protein
MRKFIVGILLLVLSSCRFGVIGDPNDDPTMRKQNANTTYNCTRDDQCIEGTFCYKNSPDNYIGVCARYKY